MAPELPIDSFYPYVHLERSFMHLGFHIFDLAFQSRNSEAAIPMVFVTTLLLITLVFVMNIVSIIVRNRLKRKFFAGHF
jgi:phosphate transport system permease protein